ncbi:TPA: hypothetical protein ACG0NJ_002145 [Clostridium perfringens]|jgi:hypothetical protein|uniref:hypothetical protein n=1 Tax=Clostridium perfringens TaxID=1502 RepID=UPI0005D1A766|nr:hypothetical protein [Clostridium perfringens]MCH1961292.1 hypothetical protein [Clostridium perfringens]MDM0731952.1 hypothetical protein [Clostridium perfringens]UBK67532.1 hypothetical protein KLF46_13945 [Clostridium perfringens]UBL09408.1 hypothetical protein KLF39_14105 [Clostridium perfringens]SQB59758.1 Uncharacterised protein [Clostridium perfringens]
MKKLKQIFYDYIEDFFIFLGLLIIVITTLILNIFVGMYVLGAILLILGIFFAKHPFKRR